MKEVLFACLLSITTLTILVAAKRVYAQLVAQNGSSSYCYSETSDGTITDLSELCGTTEQGPEASDIRSIAEANVNETFWISPNATERMRVQLEKIREGLIAYEMQRLQRFLDEGGTIEEFNSLPAVDTGQTIVVELEP